MSRAKAAGFESSDGGRRPNRACAMPAALVRGQKTRGNASATTIGCLRLPKFATISISGSGCRTGQGFGILCHIMSETIVIDALDAETLDRAAGFLLTNLGREVSVRFSDVPCCPQFVVQFGVRRRARREAAGQVPVRRFLAHDRLSLAQGSARAADQPFDQAATRRNVTRRSKD